MNEDPQTPIAPVGFAVIRSYIAVLETAERTERENPHYSWFEMGAILRALHNLAERDEHQDRELHHLRRSIHNLTVQFHAFVAGESNEDAILQNLQAQIDALKVDLLTHVHASGLEIPISGENMTQFNITLSGTHSISGVGPITADDGLIVNVTPSAGGSETFLIDPADPSSGVVSGENAGGTYTLAFTNAGGADLGSQSFTWGAVQTDTLTAVTATGVEVEVV